MRSEAAPLPARVASMVTRSFWRRVVGGDSVESTNDECMRLARSGAPEGTVVVAAAQTRGRGRLGREWASPEGGVYLSVLLHPREACDEISALPLVVGLGIALGLEPLGVRVALKWPNDVLAVPQRASRQDGRDGPGGKVAGVLLESATRAGRVAWVVAGCGVNVQRPTASAGVPSDAAYLQELAGRPLDIAEVAALVLDGIADALTTARSAGTARAMASYESLSVLTGRDVTVSDGGGAVLAAGTVQGVDRTGALLVLSGGEVTAVRAGDVTLRTDSGDRQP